MGRWWFWVFRFTVVFVCDGDLLVGLMWVWICVTCVCMTCCVGLLGLITVFCWLFGVWICEFCSVELFWVLDLFFDLFWFDVL